MMSGDGRIDDVTAAALQGGKRAWLVLAHHSAKSGDIGCQYGGKAALKLFCGHEVRLTLGNAPPMTLLALNSEVYRFKSTRDQSSRQ